MSGGANNEVCVTTNTRSRGFEEEEESGGGVTWPPIAVPCLSSGAKAAQRSSDSPYTAFRKTYMYMHAGG